MKQCLNNMDTSETPTPSASGTDGGPPKLSDLIKTNNDERNQWTEVRAKRPYSNGEPRTSKIRKSDNQPKTSNRFESRSDSEHEEDKDEENHANTTTTKKKPLPPIVIYGKTTDLKAFVTMLDSKVKNGFYIKNSVNNTNLFVYDKTDWNEMKNFFQNEKVRFHTYTLKEEKKHSFVLYGLEAPAPSPPNTDDYILKEIEDELVTKFGIKDAKCIRMKTKKNALFMILTAQDVSLKTLTTQVRFLHHTRISWDRLRNSKRIIQCHRCQRWGHATANCGAETRCLKCAENHWTRECSKPLDEAATCVNCKGPHPANNVECPVYIKHLENTQKQTNDPNGRRRYTDAPTPMHNAWTRNERFDAHQRPTTSEPARKPLSQQLEDAREFPRLQQTTQGIPLSTRQQTNTHSQETTHLQGGNTQIFNELIKEMHTLNSLVNMNELLRATRDLNEKLRNCHSGMDKVIAFQQFSATIESYNI